MIAIILTIWGIKILVKREVTIRKGSSCKGMPAVAIGILFVSIFPISFVLGMVVGVVIAVTGSDVEILTKNAIFIDLAVLAMIVISAFFIATKFGKTDEELAQAQPGIDAGADEPQSYPAVDPSNPFQPPSTR